MGFPSFPSISAGLLIIVTIILSLQSVTEIIAYLIKLIQRRRRITQNTRNATALRMPRSGALGLFDDDGYSSPSLMREMRETSPVWIYNETQSGAIEGEGEGERECAVCLNAFERGDEMRKLLCGHSFHRGCVDRWVENQHCTCPLCRASLLPKETAEMLRRRQQELTHELLLCFASFHGHGFNSMWWLR